MTCSSPANTRSSGTLTLARHPRFWSASIRYWACSWTQVRGSEGRIDVLVLVPVHLYGRELTGRREQQVSCVRVDALVAHEGRVELEREAGLGDDGVQAQDLGAGPREPRLARGRLAVEGEL